MGIHDREYYRREGPSFLRSLAEQGTMCKWLIGINVVIFLVQALSHQAIDGYLALRPGSFKQLSQAELDALHVPVPEGLSPREQQQWQDRHDLAVLILERQQGVMNGYVWQLLTYAFLHSTANIWHIVFNMLFLWWFGREMEEMYGPREFLIFYLVSATLGGVAYCLWSWTQHENIPCVGASGAVTAVMVLFAFHYPRRIIYMFWFVPVPIWLFVGFEVLQDLYSFVSRTHSGVAVTVHLAGAAFGFAYYKRMWRLYPLVQSAIGFVRGRPRLRVLREQEPVPRRPAPSAPAPASTGITTAPSRKVDEQLEAKVDAVLEKVARNGRDSLSESEKELLMRASEVYKRRKQT